MMMMMMKKKKSYAKGGLTVGELPGRPMRPRIECPIDCKLSDWEAWTPCNPYCQGDQQRTRRDFVLWKTLKRRRAKAEQDKCIPQLLPDALASVHFDLIPKNPRDPIGH